MSTPCTLAYTSSFAPICKKFPGLFKSEISHHFANFVSSKGINQYQVPRLLHVILCNLLYFAMYIALCWTFFIIFLMSCSMRRIATKVKSTLALIRIEYSWGNLSHTKWISLRNDGYSENTWCASPSKEIHLVSLYLRSFLLSISP